MLGIGLSATACYGGVEAENAGAHTDTDCDTYGGFEPPTCDTDPQALIDGAWDPNLLNWDDVAEPGADPAKEDEYDDIIPHHASLTAIHAAHLPTGELLLYHGQSDQRLWTIGAPSTEMRWVPIPYGWPEDGQGQHSAFCSYEPPNWANDCYPDIFCAGSVLLERGIFVAGGNVTGRASGGGIYESFLFNPGNANPSVPPYGWTQGPMMQEPRWYPTLTVLPDGKVLVAGGSNGPNLNTNTFELYDPDASTSTTLDVPFEWGDMPMYPFMFVLPNGDVLYAGGEDAEFLGWRGRILVPDYDDPEGWHWADGVVFTSTTSGGSAVMYAPGKVLKTGGINDPTQIAVDTAEVLDLSGCVESGNYNNAPSGFTEVTPMNSPRHFHTLTVLPDGRVLATGGNEKGNGELFHDQDNPCDYPAGSGTWIKDMTCTQDASCPAVPGECVEGECPALDDKPCSVDAQCGTACDETGDCGLGAECHGGLCYLDAGVGSCPSCPEPSVCISGECRLAALSVCEGGRCDPLRNECWATKEAEIWDPGCDEWVTLGEQQRPRMYHSTALLLPSGEVISMGGGHRESTPEESNAEYFEPEYGTGSKPTISLGLPTIDGASSLMYGQDFEITIANPNPLNVPPDRVVLVRLGNVTHGFDMDQRWVPLDATWPTPWTSSTRDIMAVAPTNPAVAPPGYYMLFVLTTSGEPSVGAYVRLTESVPQVWTCPANTTLTAVETSCTTQPTGGVCPGGSQQQNAVALPVASGASGAVSGWNVVTPPGMVMDPTDPTPSEIAAVEGLCIQACQMEWGDPAITAPCEASGAFDPPEFFYADAEPTLDMIPPSYQNGQGIWQGQQLTCMLGSTCWPAFDESLSKAVPARPTPPEPLVGTGEAYRVALGSTSKLDVITALGTYSRQLAGIIGFTPCRDGNSTKPCPFYVSSLVGSTGSSLGVGVRCDDLTTDTMVLEEFAVILVQPGFGIARQSSTSRAFPPGALVFKTHVKVDGVVYEARRANGNTVIVSVNGTAISGSNLDVRVRVPCNNSTATITGRLTLNTPSSTAIEWPPTVWITTPSQVYCFGNMINLTANTSDPDGDLAGVRWKVDGVLIAPGTTAIPFTGPHTLEAVASDARGARTTAKKVVTCVPL